MTSVRRGERFEGEVRDLSSAGQGIVAHPSGRVFFVPGVWVGERGDFEVTALKGRSGQARLVRLTAAAPQRIDAPCPHHGFGPRACGGCPWQFMEYGEQLRAKEERVAAAVAKLGSAVPVAGILGSPDTLAYRNRAQLKTDGKRLGYVAAGSRELVDIDDCPILDTQNRETLAALRSQLPNPRWRPRRGRDWTTLDIDDGIGPADVQVNQRRPFRQGNSAQNVRMQGWLAGIMPALADEPLVLELFAGAGNFTAVLVAAGCGNVIAVDSFGPAIAELETRGLPGVSTRCQDLWRPAAAQALGEVLERAGILVLDPPRDGLRALDEFLDLAPRLRHIVYISCDVATWAREAAMALQRGFALEEVQPLDLFPHTPHVELLTLLSRDR